MPKEIIHAGPYTAIPLSAHHCRRVLPGQLKAGMHRWSQIHTGCRPREVLTAIAAAAPFAGADGR